MSQSVAACTTAQGSSSFNKTDLPVDICDPTPLHHSWQMRLCICVDVCLHVSVHACLLFLHVCMSMYIYMHMCLYSCTYSPVCVCLRVYVWQCVCAYMYTCVPILYYLHVCMWSCEYACECVPTHVHIIVCLRRPELDVTQSVPHAPLCPPALGLHFCAIIPAIHLSTRCKCFSFGRVIFL